MLADPPLVRSRHLRGRTAPLHRQRVRDAQILLATLAQKLRLDLVPGLPVVPESLTTL